MAIPSSLVHHGEQLFFLAPRAGDLACATFLLVGTNLPFMGAGRAGGGQYVHVPTGTAVGVDNIKLCRCTLIFFFNFFFFSTGTSLCCSGYRR